METIISTNQTFDKNIKNDKNNNNNNNMLTLSPENSSSDDSKTIIKKRQRVTQACLNCQKTHMSCDQNRPCKRCIEKGIEMQCIDGISRKRGRKKSNSLNSNKEITNNFIHSIQSMPLSLNFSSPLLHQTKFNNPQNNFNDININIIENNNSIINNENNILEKNISTSTQMDGSPELPINFLSEILFSQMDGLSSLKVPETNKIEKKEIENNQNNTLTAPHCINPNPLLECDCQQKGLNASVNNEEKKSWCCFRSFLKSKFPDDIEIEKQIRVIFQSKKMIHALQQTLHPDIIQHIKIDFNNHLNNFINIFYSLAIPTIIWERCGVIHFVNKAWIEITGFSENLPTKIENFSLHNQLNYTGVKSLLKFMRENMLDPEGNNTMFNIGLLSNKNQEKEFIEGTFCISVKRDIVGLPLIFIGNFLPKLNPLYIEPKN